MIDGLKTYAQNLSDKADDLLAINIDTYNRLHDFNVNGTGFIAEDTNIFGATLDVVRIIDTSFFDTPATSTAGIRPRFYDTSNIICCYGAIGGGFSIAHWKNATSYKLFNLSSLELSSEAVSVSDGIICPLKTTSGHVDLYSTYSEAQVQLKKKDSSMANLTTTNITGLTRAELLYYDTNKPNKYLGHWAGLDEATDIVTIAFLTRTALDEPIMLRQYVTNLSGTEVSDTSTQIPFAVWSSEQRFTESLFDFGMLQKQTLNNYLQIIAMYGDYILCVRNAFGKRFLAVHQLSTGDMIYIDSDMLFLYGSIFTRYAGYGIMPTQTWTDVGDDLDGQVIDQVAPGTPYTQSLTSSIVADFMVTTGYIHLIVRNYNGIYYYLKFRWDAGT